MERSWTAARARRRIRACRGRACHAKDAGGDPSAYPAHRRPAGVVGPSSLTPDSDGWARPETATLVGVTVTMPGRPLSRPLEWRLGPCLGPFSDSDSDSDTGPGFRAKPATSGNQPRRACLRNVCSAKTQVLIKCQLSVSPYRDTGPSQDKTSGPGLPLPGPRAHTSARHFVRRRSQSSGRLAQRITRRLQSPLRESGTAAPFGPCRPLAHDLSSLTL